MNGLEFKKVSPEEKMKSVGPLLKTYQQEIDQLTQRCKGAEVCGFSWGL